MKIKKYTGLNEKEAMFKVREELGREALIVNVKKIKPKGVFKFFRKPYVEVTAASDEKTVDPVVEQSAEQVAPTIDLKAKDEGELDEGSFIHLLRELSRKELNQEPTTYDASAVMASAVTKSETVKLSDDKEVHEPVLTMIYEQLLENEVDEKIINELMVGLEDLARDDEEIDSVIGALYKRIVKKLSEVEPIQLDFDESKVAVFVGPTGVGKTTTIAKIASYFTLNLGKKVALITADTYRIAAVEQLRTYSNILNIPIKVVYNNDEMNTALKQFEDIDLVLVDTAGRSPNHTEHQKELVALLENIPEKDIFLVLSLATKYTDLKRICSVYAALDSFKLIFTKLDETSSYGNIINIKEMTHAKLSYVTFGQNVPDDISEFDTHEIAKKTLGGCEI